MRILKSILVISSIAFSALAQGQAADTREWVCEFCPFEDGHRADYEVGVTSVGDDTAYFGDATGYDEDGVYANVDGHGSYANEGYRMRWSVEDLALDSRAVAIDAGHPGKFDINLGYRELPRRRFNTTASIYQSSNDGTLTLPSGWVGAPTTSGFTALDSSLSQRNIESDRGLFEIGGRFLPSTRWAVSADYRRRENDGVQLYSGSSFTSSAELAKPLDYVTDEVDFAISYSAGNGFITLGWYLSDFENGNAALRWESPYFLVPGSTPYAMAQAPDSRFQQMSLQAGYSFPEQKTVVSISAATGEIEQDSAFLPYTSNSAITADPLPRTSLDGQVDTGNFALTATSRFIDKLRVKFSYRYDERDDQSERSSWNRVITDTFVSNDPELNTTYSFQRNALSVSGDYDLLDTVRVSAGYDRKEVDRDFSEVAEQTEDTGWGRLRWRPTPALELDVRGGTSKRDIDSYNETFATTLGQNPLLRKYNLAYRFREFGEISMSFSPADVPVSVTLSAMLADDSYDKSELGITSGDELAIAADVGWTISDNASAYLTVGMEDMESEQYGSALFATPDWRATHDDDFTTIGAGFVVRNIGENVDFHLDYLRTDGASEITVNPVVGVASEFPELKSELDYLRFRLAYHRSERLEINLNLRYQSFNADDWALEGVTPATIPVVLSLGAEPYDEDQVMIGLGFRYQMGAKESASE